MASERKANEFYEEMRSALHDLCQPLTTLRCRMELALMQSDPQQPGCEELRECLQEGLDDIRRSFQSVERMRQSLLAEMRLRP